MCNRCIICLTMHSCCIRFQKERWTRNTPCFKIIVFCLFLGIRVIVNSRVMMMTIWLASLHEKFDSRQTLSILFDCVWAPSINDLKHRIHLSSPRCRPGKQSWSVMLRLETGLCLASLSPIYPISIPREQTSARILKPSMLDKHDFLLRFSSSLGRSGWSEWLKDATGPEDLKVCCS